MYFQNSYSLVHMDLSRNLFGEQAGVVLGPRHLREQLPQVPGPQLERHPEEGSQGCGRGNQGGYVRKGSKAEGIKLGG